MSTTASWAAAAINIAMMMAPPLAIVALPILFQTYKLAHNGSFLNSCYMDMMADVILRVAQHTKLSAMPPEQREDLLKIFHVSLFDDIFNTIKCIEIVLMFHIV